MKVNHRTRTWQAIRKFFREGGKLGKDMAVTAIGAGILTTIYHELRQQQRNGNLNLGNIPGLIRRLAPLVWTQAGNGWNMFLRGRRAVKVGITRLIWTIPVWTTLMFLVAAFFGSTAEILFALVAILYVASRLILNGGWVVDTAFAMWLFSRPLGYELNWSHDQAKGILGKFRAIIEPKEGETAVPTVSIPKITGVEVEGPAKFDLNYKRPLEDTPFSFFLVVMLVLINYAIGIYFMNARYWLPRGGLGLIGVIILSQFGWLLGSYVMHRRTLDYYKWIAIPDAIVFLGLMFYMILGGVGHSIATSDTLAGNVVRATESKVVDNPLVLNLKTKGTEVVHTDTFRVPAKMPAGEIYTISPQDSKVKVKSWRVLKVTDVDPRGVCWDTDPVTGQILACSDPDGERYTPMQTDLVLSYSKYGFSSKETAARKFFAPNLNMGTAICSPDGEENWSPCKGFTAKGIQSIQVVAANQRRDWTARDTGSRIVIVEYTAEVRYEVLPDGSTRVAASK